MRGGGGGGGWGGEVGWRLERWPRLRHPRRAAHSLLGEQHALVHDAVDVHADDQRVIRAGPTVTCREKQIITIKDGNGYW